MISQMRDTRKEKMNLERTLLTYQEIKLRESEAQRKKFDTKIDHLAGEINNLKNKLKEACDVTDEFKNNPAARNYRKLLMCGGLKDEPGKQPIGKDVMTTLNSLLHRIQRGGDSVDTLKFVTEELKCIVRETREPTQQNQTQTKKGRKKSSYMNNRGR